MRMRMWARVLECRRCDKCCYHYAPSAAALDDHKREKHNTEPFLCNWPGCQIACSDADDLDEHVRRIHELEMWFCEGQNCYQRFTSEEDILKHIDLAHSEENLGHPRLINQSFRTFTDATLEAIWTQYLQRLKITCPDVGVHHEIRASYYKASYHPSARSYFAQRGLIGQKDNEGSDECRTVDDVYKKRHGNLRRPQRTYEFKTFAQRSWHWWVLFLNQEEGSWLDKFIDDAVLGWSEVSHKCHRPWCFVFSHLEFVRIRAVS